MLIRSLLSFLFICYSGVVILPRQEKVESFPCTKCHVNLKAPIKSKSQHSGLKFSHFEEIRDCRTCHSITSPDRLILLNGQTLSYNQSYRICEQCHGIVYRDWQSGLHGKRIGSWNGEKKQLSCLECHNAHDPKFKKMVASKREKPLKKKGDQNGKGH